MLYGAVQNRFGRYYKLHVASQGLLPEGPTSKQFSDPVQTMQFIRDLQAPESYWRYLVHSLSPYIGSYSSLEQALCQLLMDGRVKVFDITDYYRNRYQGSSNTIFKGPEGSHIRVLPASARLVVNGNYRRFGNARDAVEFLSRIDASEEQLRALAGEHNISLTGRANESIRERVAQALAKGKLALLETTRNDASGKKSTQELLDVHDGLPGNRRPTLGPHAGSGSTVPSVIPPTVAAASAPSQVEEEEPVCSLSQFEMKCSHGSRGSCIDVINGEANLNDNKGLQVVSKHDSPDKITITISGTCVNGEDNCPSVSVASDAGTEEVKKGSNQIKVLPKEINEQVTGFTGFLKKYMVPDLGRMQYRIYRLTSSGCGGCATHSAIVHAFPTYKWSGKVGFGYRDKEGKDSKDENSLVAKGGWFLDAGLNGTIHKNTWSLETKDQNQISDYFPALKGFVTELVEKLDDIADSAAKAAAEDSGLTVGGDALKFKVAWPKITLGGGVSLEEVKGRHIVDLEGHIKLSMSPLLGLDIEADVIDWLMWNAGPHGELIRAIRNKIKEGFGTEQVNASADISVKLKMKGKVDIDFEWKKAAGEPWRISKGDGTGKTAMAVTVGLEGKAEAKTRIFMVKIAMGVTIGVMGANSSSEGIGVAMSLFATTKDDKPALGGEVQFTGVAVYYTYYAEASIKEISSEEKTRTRSRGGDDAIMKNPETNSKQKTERKFLLIKAASWPKHASQSSEKKQSVLIDQLST